MTRIEIEGRQGPLRRQLDACLPPVEASGDHEMQHQPKLALDSDRDPFTKAAQLLNLLSFDCSNGGVRCAQEKRTRQSNALELLAEDSLLQCFDVDYNIR